MSRVQKIDLSVGELSVSERRETILQEAVAALQRDGIVCLKRAIPRESVEKLNIKMQADLDAVETDRSRNPWDSLRPPPFDPYLYRQIVYNDVAADICIAWLGMEATLTTYAANTSWPDQSAKQNIHRDVPSAPIGPSSPGVVINIPLTTFTKENGATLIYPGTHELSFEDAEGARGISPQTLEEQSKNRPPVQTIDVDAGDLIIRDLRLWHGGMPNITRERRIMLALVVIDPAYHEEDESVFKGFDAEQGSEAFWEHPKLKTAVSFVPQGDRTYYLQGGHSAPLTPLRKDWIARGKDKFIRDRYRT